jgi:hypothetical protein
MNRTPTALAVLVSCCLPLLASSAAAENTPITTVKSIAQDTGTGRSGDALIELTGFTCTPTGGSAGALIVLASDPQHASLLSFTLSAYLAGKQVMVSYDAPSCAVRSIKLL